MEGVGARLGRSSSRYGTTTVFNGPVRKWKKEWVPIPPSSSSSSSNSNHHHHHSSSIHHHSSSNGAVNGSNGNSGSHLRLYKWAPVNKENSNSNDNNNSNSNSKISNSDVNGGGGVANGSKDTSTVDDVVSEEPPRRKFKYIPIAVLEEQKKEAEENSDDDDEAKPAESDENVGEQAAKSDGNAEKPDINDVPMEENQDVEENQTTPARQDLNELDLSLGLTSHDEEHDSDSKTDPKADGQIERANSGA
ncbi:uncharacterized protein DDB_G0287625-like [Chenopodium quinoa]|uniref:uncharacterized protein DDB_G0287625-like n=1 Tax=Chenopodium quinoa TaxID=63459 RepID=UPI000B76BB9A|nr:uncharacterized protein DDB_G0287625-like [Chenopodium quinoa]